jgi:hypothetical protein
VAPVDPTKFRLWVGPTGVQAYVVRRDPFFMEPFGVTVIDAARPTLPEARRVVAQAILDRVNAGELTIEEGMQEINKHAFCSGDEAMATERPVLQPKPPRGGLHSD